MNARGGFVIHRPWSPGYKPDESKQSLRMDTNYITVLVLLRLYDGCKDWTSPVFTVQYPIERRK
jgi:hypothetical protein